VTLRPAAPSAASAIGSPTTVAAFDTDSTAANKWLCPATAAATRFARERPSRFVPLPYLPYCRIPLCILMALYHRHVSEKQKISDCVRWLGQTWKTVKRAANLAKRLIGWFNCQMITGTLL